MSPIIDSHCHAYPDAIADRASAGISAFYDCPIAFDGRVSTMLAEGGAAGVTHCVLSSVATTPHQVGSVNGFLAETAAAHPDVISSLGSLHPDSADQAGDVARLRALGLKGVKLHPDIQGVAVDDPRYLRIFELCEGVLPVLCHLGDKRYDYSNPNRVRRVLETFPGLTLIGAHFGGWSVWQEATEQLHEYPNLLVDCSSSLFALTPAEGRALVRAYGAGRVLFGTDYPMWSPEGELRRLDALELDESERAAILYQNAAALYGLPASEAEAR